MKLMKAIEIIVEISFPLFVIFSCYAVNVIVRIA